MRRRPTIITQWLLAIVLVAGLSWSSPAKSYSSGGHSYSSHSSSSHSYSSSHSFSSGSHSFSSGGSSSHSSGFGSGGSSHSFTSGGSHTFSSGSSRSSGSDSGKSWSSGGGKSYSSGSTWNDSTHHSYSAGKSYGSGRLFGSEPGPDSPPVSTHSYRQSQPAASSSGMTFDTGAARARKEQASKEQFTHFKDSQTPAPKATDFASSRSEPVGPSSSYRVRPPPLPSGSGSYRRTVYIPDAQVLSTRRVRVYNVFNPYWSRPVVVYQDPYSSLFWWWLLDRSLDDRAYWAYHHRYDMDPARYQALVDNDRQLEARVADLEAQQAPRDPNYVPPALDRDLMYTDQHVARVYSNRPTAFGTMAFYVLGVPTALAFTGFFIWLIWFKRWQTAT